MERRSYDEKLARILRTAAAEFAERGFHNTSIRDISRASGVSLSGLYYYFRSKEELLFLIQDHCFGTVLENLERVLGEERDPRTRLRLLVRNHVRFFAANMKEMKVLSHEADTLTGEYRREVSARKRRYTELCLDIVAELRQPDQPMTGRTATFALFGMLNWIYNWYDPERDVPVAELAEHMSRLFLFGIESAAGVDTGSAVGGGQAPGGAVAGDEAGPSIWRT